MSPPRTTGTLPVSAVVLDLFGTLARWSPRLVTSPAHVFYALARRPALDARRLVALVEGADGEIQFDPTDRSFAAWQREAWERASRYADVDLTDRVLAVLRDVVEGRQLDLYPDSADALHALRTAGIPWVLCANAAPDALSKLLAGLPPALRPRASVVSSALGCRKPHDRMFRAAIASCDCPPGQILFLGDRVDCDVDAARNHGLQAVLVDRSGRRGPGDAPDVWTDLAPLTTVATTGCVPAGRPSGPST